MYLVKYIWLIYLVFHSYIYIYIYIYILNSPDHAFHVILSWYFDGEESWVTFDTWFVIPHDFLFLLFSMNCLFLKVSRSCFVGHPKLLCIKNKHQNLLNHIIDIDIDELFGYRQSTIYCHLKPFHYWLLYSSLSRLDLEPHWENKTWPSKDQESPTGKTGDTATTLSSIDILLIRRSDMYTKKNCPDVVVTGPHWC